MKNLSNEKKRAYEAPQLTAVTFKVEQGFAFSQFTIGRPPIDEIEDAIYGMQDYEVENEQHWF